MLRRLPTSRLVLLVALACAVLGARHRPGRRRARRLGPQAAGQAARRRRCTTRWRPSPWPASPRASRSPTGSSTARASARRRAPLLAGRQGPAVGRARRALPPRAAVRRGRRADHRRRAHRRALRRDDEQRLPRHAPAGRGGRRGRRTTTASRPSPPSPASSGASWAGPTSPAPSPPPSPGRPAYTVRIAPKHDGGLIGAAELAWDAATARRCARRSTPPATAKPVLELTATDISYGKVDAAALGVGRPARREDDDGRPRRRGAPAATAARTGPPSAAPGAVAARAARSA